MASTYLVNANPTAGNRTKGTISVWVKRGNLGGTQWIYTERSGSNDYAGIRFNSANRFGFFSYTGGNAQVDINTVELFRDTNAWYHIVTSWDTTLGTASDRVKIYVNGARLTTFNGSPTYASQDVETQFGRGGSSYPINIGRPNDTAEYFNGSMSHFHRVDNQALAQTVFGSTDSTTGEWKINTSPSITYTGSSSFNFFVLKDGNSVTDQSGNSNNLTVGGGTLTKTEDNPSNVFATLNPLHTTGITGNYYLSLGNLRQHVTNNDGHRETGFTLHPKGLKGYFEVKCTVDPNFHLGLQNVASQLVKTNYYTLASPNYYYMQASNPVKISYANGGSSANHIADYFSQISTGDIIGCAFDFTGTNKNVWFHKNGTYGNNGSGVGNPATGAYPAMTSTQLTADEYEFIVSPNTGSGNGQLDFNFGNGVFGTTAVSSAGTNASNNGIFEYDVPSGFTALSTKGLNL